MFEFLILEGAQAGLSWSNVLKKRENYRKAFDDWDFNKIAKYIPSHIVNRIIGQSGLFTIHFRPGFS